MSFLTTGAYLLPRYGPMPYAERDVLFVGATELDEQLNEDAVFAPRTTTGGQTVDNTVVVGQKVHAKVETSSKVSLYNTYGVEWTHPSGGNAIRNYITNDSEGTIVELSEQYYNSGGMNSTYFTDNFVFYYTSSTAYNKIGGLNATFNLVDANGNP